MKQVEIKNGERYGKLVKALQVLSFVLMLAMLVLCVVFLSKNHISVKTADQLTQYLTGGDLTVALIIIGFSVVEPIRRTIPLSSAGRSASDCALLQRWHSSRRRYVG